MSDRARPVRTGLPAGALSWSTAVCLSDGWLLTSAAPGAYATPRELPEDAVWTSAVVPGTVAQAVGPDDLDAHEDYDGLDWWYRCTLPAPARAGERRRLRLDGLATLAEVWLDGELVLTANDMFTGHEIDLPDSEHGGAELHIAFRSLRAALGARRPRPRWKTKLVDEQQLRWFRTTLLGRIPGWTPAIPPVGPWLPVWLESADGPDLLSLRVRPSLRGSDGVLDVEAAFGVDTGSFPSAATLRVGSSEYALAMRTTQEGAWVAGQIVIPSVAKWWPATHGEPVLHDCSLVLEMQDGKGSIDCGRIGFRDVRIDRTEGRIEFVVNGVPVFCRGSCWTTNDIVSLVGDPERLRREIELLALAHGNMLRVGGTMVYESDAFYRTCDELGVMVWQDFMFANMDYPVEDPSFAGVVREEAAFQLRRLARHASVVAYCGGSEIEQQAAMFGAPREIWSNAWFSEELPALVEEHAPGAPYWPSTPTGGVLPFYVGEGLAHYYGVGAYRRPLDDVRLAGVRFTPECLGFSHVPEAENLRSLTPSGAVPPHHPAWKRGVPRDTGPGWDFEDVRDHYLKRLYGVHAVDLRSDDLERYLSLSRMVTGEVMAHVFSEWRRAGDPCGGALTWFWNDLRPGAGWGVLDSDARPKPVYYHLRRAWAQRCVRLLDRGVDGLVALVINETGSALAATLELCAFARGSASVAEAAAPVALSARGATEVSVEEALGHFLDSTYAYRFGPPRHEAVVARLVAEDGRLLSEDVYRPVRSAMAPASGLVAEIRREGSGLALTLTAESMCYGVRLDVRDHLPEDDYFHLSPGRSRVVRLTRIADTGRAFQGYVEALNLSESIRLTLAE